MIDISPNQDPESARKIVNISHVGQRCPSIAFSTGIDRETLEALASGHCFAIFPKPFDTDEVMKAIRESLEAHAKSVDALLSPVFHGIISMLHGPQSK